MKRFSRTVRSGKEARLLENDRDAARVGLVGLDIEGWPLSLICPLIGLVDPRDDLHEGGLAGAVLAADGVYFGPAQVDGHVRERAHSGKSW